MAKRILADFPFLRNQPMCTQRNLEDVLWDLDALLAVASDASNFYELPAGVIHRYYTVIADLMKEIVWIYETTLRNLRQG
jgi:hypothetical protein